ncbi:hypothetical protein HPB51_002650 [Rhipicephalus microplus]|uniref:Protein ST7 homolog n=1 Tax=Rhipicephalus microplus TaxID=6941 RepID=A0A9J6DF04_RHIMP|nr:hypothetical protein HPB51_002650 [Rhipicephalus microplus]
MVSHGLPQIFEWWYFRKYGTSFIEQVSLNHLSPWLGGTAEEAEGDRPLDRGPTPSAAGECKVWRNPLSLLRGAEYSRFLAATRREPLTFYDMNLSAQDHQTLFACEADAGHPDCEGGTQHVLAVLKILH